MEGFVGGRPEQLGSTESQRQYVPGTELEGLFPQSFTKKYLQLEQGEGPYVRDRTGNWYFDAISGSKNVNIGYGRERVAEAAFEQMTDLTYASSNYLTDTVREFGNLLQEFTPDGFEHVWLVSGGSLANESAMKMARQYHVERGAERKHKVIARRNSYHGNTAGAMAVSGSPQFMSLMDPLFADYPKAPSGTRYRCQFCDGHGGVECGRLCAEELRRTIREEGAENVAAVITEPINSLTNAGAVPHDGYFERLREVCDELGVLWIADEIMTGLGRTGLMWGMDHWDVMPDIITTGKGLSSGYAPLGAVIPSDDIVEVFTDTSGFAHSHTYCQNPIAAAVGTAVLEFFKNQDVVTNARRMGDRLRSGLDELATYDCVGDVRGKGLLQAVEFVADPITDRPLSQTDSELLRETIRDKGLELGVLTATEAGHLDGNRGDLTIVAPPLTVSKSMVDDLTAWYHEIVRTVDRRIDA